MQRAFVFAQDHRYSWHLPPWSYPQCYRTPVVVVVVVVVVVATQTT